MTISKKVALLGIISTPTAQPLSKRPLSFSTYTDLSQKPEILELIRAEVERINMLLPEGSRVRRFANFPKELDPDEGELTRSRKLRRAFLEERYADLVEAIYGGDHSVDLEIAVTYQDGRRGVLRVHVAVTDVEGAPRTARKQHAA